MHEKKPLPPEPNAPTEAPLTEDDGNGPIIPPDKP